MALCFRSNNAADCLLLCQFYIEMQFGLFQTKVQFVINILVRYGWT